MSEHVRNYDCYYMGYVAKLFVGVENAQERQDNYFFTHSKYNRDRQGLDFLLFFFKKYKHIFACHFYIANSFVLIKEILEYFCCD